MHRFLYKTQKKTYMNANRTKRYERTKRRLPKRIQNEMKFSFYLKDLLKELKIKC